MIFKRHLSRTLFGCHTEEAHTQGSKKIEPDGTDGTVLKEYLWDHWFVNDPNHVQLIEEDTVAIVSSRVNNCVLRVRLGTGTDDSEIEWIMNGKNSTMLLYDFNGTVYEPDGAYLFESQHNAEYMGDDMYYVVNDGERIAAESGASLLSSTVRRL